MRCSLKATSLGKMRGVEKSEIKKDLTTLGVVTIFVAAIVLIYNPHPVAGVSLSVGICIVALCHSVSLAFGTTFLAFGTNFIVLGIFYLPHSFSHPLLPGYASHIVVGAGFIFFVFGILLVTLSLTKQAG